MNILCSQCKKEIKENSKNATKSGEIICQECSKFRFIEEQIQYRELIRRIQLSMEGHELLLN